MSLFRCASLVFLSSAHLAPLTSASAADDVRRSAALRDDDACAAGDGACALNALQARSRPALTGDGQARGTDDAKGAGDADDGWVWPEDVALKQMMGTEFSLHEYGDVFNFASPIVNRQCPPFVAYLWPQISFWSQEILRRVEAFPDDAPAEGQAKLQHFARNAAYTSCVSYFDPRSGSDFSEHVTGHMQSVMDLPSTSLEMPDLPEYFSKLEGTQRMKLVAVDACMMWTQAMSCDLGYIGRDLKGSKDTGGKVCWDKVPLPAYGMTILGVNMYPDRPKLNESLTDEFDHTDYLVCQEKPLLVEDIASWCPMAGHWPDGMWNASWGEPSPLGSQRRSDVLTCNKKIGNPSFSSLTAEMVHIADEGEDVDIMKPFRGYLINKTSMEQKMDEAMATPRSVTDESVKNMAEQVAQAVLKVAAKQAVKTAMAR
mmetsp:Transcript_43719/g.140225  ORF Transcript_43719/g.140225 Transcript_43719/m.140225 type:complete len:429 (-) Transcript_43719:140-1426(-)